MHLSAQDRRSANTPAPQNIGAQVLNHRGLYLLRQPSRDKGVDHYAVLDVGNILNISGASSSRPFLIHQTPPSIRIDDFHQSGQWWLMGKVQDEIGAAFRLRAALENSEYDLFGNNCEHFARFVTTGVRESSQLQSAVSLVGVVALLCIALRS